MGFPEPPHSPAILVFREYGELLFCNPYAHALLGLSFEAKEDLQGWCMRCFPDLKDYDRVAKSLRRALSGEGLSAGGSFRAQFLNAEGRLMAGTFHVVSWREKNGEARAMLTCIPTEQPGVAALAPSPQLPPMESMADLITRIGDLLDVAVTIGRVSIDDGGPVHEAQDLIERLEYARGVLKDRKQRAS
jgi:PAS domain-containing protein